MAEAKGLEVGLSTDSQLVSVSTKAGARLVAQASGLLGRPAGRSFLAFFTWQAGLPKTAGKNIGPEGRCLEFGHSVRRPSRSRSAGLVYFPDLRLSTDLVNNRRSGKSAQPCATEPFWLLVAVRDRTSALRADARA
jgi:hypothetical protein